MSRQQTKQAGFTLIEISLAMAIFTFMLLVVSLAYINIARLYNASTVARNVQQNNRFAMEQITRVARTANSVTLSAREADGGLSSICFTVRGGPQLFYLAAAGTDTKKRELRQATVADCGNPVPQAPKVLSSKESFAGRLDATSTADSTTISLWMVSRVDLLDTADESGLKCKSGAGAEFCAINKLTTTVGLRGE